jgi:hypothetical protein
MHTVNFPQIQTFVFAGGGNRCWWQAGLVTHLQAQGEQLPGQLVGTSAGAAIAASLLTGSTMTALQACQRLYAANAQLFDWHGLRQLKFKFAHQTDYPAWLAAFVHEGNFKTLQTAQSQLLVAVTRPAKALGLMGSVAAGTIAYLVDKNCFTTSTRLCHVFWVCDKRSLHCATAPQCKMRKPLCGPLRQHPLSCPVSASKANGPSTGVTPTTPPFLRKHTKKNHPRWSC